jgi:hypothetical protein
MNRDTAEGMIRPLKERIVAGILDGYSDVMKGLEPGLLASLSVRTKCNLVFDRIKYRLTLEFGLTGPIRWTQANDNRQLEFLLIDASPEGIALRPKKGDRFDTLTSNYPTDYEKRLRIEQSLPYGDEPPAHLFVTYTEGGNEIETEIERILVTCEYRADGQNHMDWWFEIYRSEGGQSLDFARGYDQPRLPGFHGKIKPASSAKPVKADGAKKIKPTGTAGYPPKHDGSQGENKRVEGGNG